jgi:Asp-tRNA(Asn)/Glu-tRNA(Gln) amidotransferase A subunit family amidase
MASVDPIDLTAREASFMIREGRLSAVELVEACLARIRALDGVLQAWVHVDDVGALATAKERDAEARSGRSRGPLHGVPVGIKDIFHVARMPTRAGAKAFAHSEPSEDAASVARLRAAGAVILGKTHTTQFAYRDPSPTRNPWNPEHTPGGSSAGSGAGVAARMVPLALGSQTVGSVLRPAAYNGVVGFKGTHGLVSADGVIPLAWSLDHVGVLARSVFDVATALGVMIGTEVTPAVVTAPRIGLLSELVARADAETAASVGAAASALARAGATVTEVKLPASFGGIGAAGLVIVEAEAAAYHKDAYARHAADFGAGIGSAVKAGLGRSATDYLDAHRARVAFRQDVMPLLAGVDALLSPTAPTVAPAGLASTGDASLCGPWSSTGVPSISLPSGVSRAGLPHAIQLVAAADRDAHLLGVAAWCERVLGFTAKPSL